MIDLKHAHTLPHPFVEADVKFLVTTGLLWIFIFLIEMNPLTQSCPMVLIWV